MSWCALCEADAAKAEEERDRLRALLLECDRFVRFAVTQCATPENVRDGLHLVARIGAAVGPEKPARGFAEWVRCKVCHGSGAAGSGRIVPCPSCVGQGGVFR